VFETTSHTRVASAALRKMVVSPSVADHETIEFLSEEKAIVKFSSGSAMVFNVQTSDSAYVFFPTTKHDPREVSFSMYIDRETGAYSGVSEVQMGSYLARIVTSGTCRPITITPKL
jgi:hypothetical protein